MTYSIQNRDCLDIQSITNMTAIEKSALDGCTSIEKEGLLLSEGKGYRGGRYVIHGSTIRNHIQLQPCSL